MSEVKVNKISPRTNCGTVTLGDSGDSFVIPSGATITNNGTQTGFGRTGTVDWQTGSIKTATFTAANGEGYFANTSGGAFNMNLPAGSAGNIVSVVDYTNSFQTYNLTIVPNGSQKIGGTNANAILATEGQSVTFVYVDDTEGWKNVQDSTSNVVGNDKIVATGGTITTCGDYKIHTFTGPGTFAVSAAALSAPDNVVDYLVVAGGGGGGGGGGGAGGMRFFANPSTNPQPGSNPAAPRNAPAGITVSATSFPITVGAGGAAGGITPAPAVTHGERGSNTVFSTITSTGGGGGGQFICGGAPGPSFEGPGGSGGGSYNTPGGGSAAGTGNTPPVSPSQGSNGGDSSPQSIDSVGFGGGGGMMAVGGTGTNGPGGGLGNAGAGGAGGGLTGFGSSNGQCSSCVQYFAGGGGGGAQHNPGPSTFSTAGIGGGGQGSSGPGPGSAPPVVPGDANTGGGAGGGSNNTPAVGGVGGSGIVVIRYRFK